MNFFSGYFEITRNLYKSIFLVVYLETVNKRSRQVYANFEIHQTNVILNYRTVLKLITAENIKYKTSNKRNNEDRKITSIKKIHIN